MTSNFIDYVKINVRSGRGGFGSSHFRREKHVPKGGPDGGDGGRGGHIYLVGNSQLWTLLHLKYQKHIIADNGKGGEGGRRSGAEGEDIFIEVPLGTIVKDAESNEFLAEVTEEGQKILLLPGGRGGMGNTHFKSSTNQSPRHAQPGEEGQDRWVIMELKVLADVGLVGFPNAGKSTLLSVLSAAKPEIADYPFTTLVPHLGVVAYRDYKSFVVADIPGIIEGASEGKGLGLRFLRHIERNSILCFLIPSDAKDWGKEYEILLGELEKFNPELLQKQRVLVVSKMDISIPEMQEEIRASLPADLPVVFISSITQEGIQELKDVLWKTLQEENAKFQADTLLAKSLQEENDDATPEEESPFIEED
ncbi:GTPase ObgE [Aquirufa nivalisilvae]|uniref:GTPase ObgE n=1 Tax=Aquirufa nivalisilvae TaxID=2516557 RepID=UPI0010329630|nr:GTPase ObgE [Aquirufa nivalisilvae]MCZ2480510.1 GTPase ObgE [Aquirufa nivalisilvae]MCZ2482745.1 GTPase ObgE [Aquirufa nivalisilvae]TBH70875.1 GTPase ObgE [Aquirufa nivalisilvae]